MKNTQLYTVEVKLLFRDLDTINNELPKIKNNLKQSFDNIIVHFDLSDEIDSLDRESIGVRIEISQFDTKNNPTVIKEMSKEIVRSIKEFDIRDYSIRTYKD